MSKIPTVNTREELQAFEREMTRTMVGSIKAGEPFSMKLIGADETTVYATVKGTIKDTTIKGEWVNNLGYPVIVTHYELLVDDYEVPVHVAFRNQTWGFTPSLLATLKSPVSLRPDDGVFITADLAELSNLGDIEVMNPNMN